MMTVNALCTTVKARLLYNTPCSDRIIKCLAGSDFVSPRHAIFPNAINVFSRPRNGIRNTFFSVLPVMFPVMLQSPLAVIGVPSLDSGSYFLFIFNSVLTLATTALVAVSVFPTMLAISEIRKGLNFLTGATGLCSHCPIIANL